MTSSFITITYKKTIMRKLTVNNFLTLDGLYEGKDKSIGWTTLYRVLR